MNKQPVLIIVGDDENTSESERQSIASLRRKLQKALIQDLESSGTKLRSTDLLAISKGKSSG